MPQSVAASFFNFENLGSGIIGGGDVSKARTSFLLGSVRLPWHNGAEAAGHGLRAFNGRSLNDFRTLFSEVVVQCVGGVAA